MAGESTSGTLLGGVTTTLSRNWSMYAVDPAPMVEHLRIEPIDPGGNIKAFARVTKDTALSATITEATGLSNVALDTAKVSATVAEHGIMRQFTKLGEKTNLLGAAGLYELAFADGVKMCMEYWETLVCAQATNASTSVGTAGAAFTIANFIGAQFQHTVNKAVGPFLWFLHATAGKNLRNECAGSGAAIFGAGAGNELLQSADASDGYLGAFMGDPIYTHNLGLVVSADTLSYRLVDGARNPTGSATACALGWTPEITPMFFNPAFSGGAQFAITMAQGLVEVNDFAYVKAATIT